MQKLQDSVFSIVKSANLSPAVFSYLQPTEDFPEKTPQGGILSDTKHGWLALGPKFCVVDLRTGLKVAAHTFGAVLSNYRTTVTSVAELPTPLTDNSLQLVISLEYEDIAGMICVFHVNGSQILRCIQTEVVVTQLAVSDGMPDGPFTCYDGIIIGGTKSGEIIVFDLNRASLIQALKDLSQGYEQMIRSEENAAHVTFLPLNLVQQIEAQRDLALENDYHSAVLLNENSLVDGQYIFRNPDGTVRMKAKRDHIRVTVLQYVPQLASVAVGFNFGAFQIWNLLNLDLEFTSQVNVECLPVTHFGFQEPCDDPRAFCYLWVVFSVIDRFDEEEFPLAVMYSLTYQGKRMLSDTKCLYQEFLTATIRFQVELSAPEDETQLIGGRCVSCHTYSVNSTLGGEGEDSMLNICQLVWECWGENANSSGQHGMLLFDLDQWYKDQMPATYQLQSNAFMSATWCSELARGACVTLDLRLSPASVSVYCAPTRLEEHFYPNSLHYDCICLNTSEACVLSTIGIQRQIINSMDEVGPTALLNPTRLYNACVATGLVPLYLDASRTTNQDEQRRYLLSVALEARLSRFLKRCAHDWATGSHSGAGCTLTFLVDWCWSRAIELKENARELTSPLFTSSALPDRNVVRCLEHCVQQLTQLTGLLDAVLTKCCNLVVPDALSEMEEKYKGIGTVSLYFQVVQWFLRCGLLPERSEACTALTYPGTNLASTYSKRRLKLHRLQDNAIGDDSVAKKPCSLLYIDQLIEQEFGGERVHQMWMRGGSECNGLYPPPSLYSLLRLYLLPDIAEEHKHSLVLYLLVDYSMVYDEVRYEAVIRRLMQFPTMFGLSNTAIKATQAFWHLDHRDFDFALDQLQCLTGNTLSDWQHNVVLSSLLAQKKTQAALQYLHVRKPAPIQNLKDNMNSSNRVNDYDKLEDWQSCCNLYLARGLVYEALDVIRMCVQNAGSFEDKITVLNFFFKGCRNTGHLSKILQVTLLPFEEEIFIRYLENCNESQTSDILIMYYLQQARYLEAEQYNSKIKHSKPRAKDMTGSLESLADVKDRESARDTIVEVACSSLPTITNTVAHCAQERDIVPHVIAPKPMSVFVQATSPKNFFTYKSSFIQDTIENASETWINKPLMRRGIKRALNIEETPFICTPKLAKNKSIFTMDKTPESTPRKRSRLDLTGTPKTPKTPAYRGNDTLSKEMSVLLDMPEAQSPDIKLYGRSGAGTPHSILKIRSSEAMLREAPSPVDSRYLGDSDDELLETASNHTHYSDSTNKHLRFTIPTASESGSTPSPPVAAPAPSYPRGQRERELSASIMREKEMDMSLDSFVTTESHVMNEPHPLESPPKKMAVESNVKSRKPYKDSVRSRRSLSISANSSLSEDPNTSIESIADIPITLVNPRYSGEMRRRSQKETRDTDNTSEEEGKSINVTATRDTDNTLEEKREVDESMAGTVEVPKTPKGRRGIRAVSSESTPLTNRSRSGTPERLDSPVVTIPLSLGRNRSRSGTPERLDSPVVSIPLSLGRNRSRSRTPEISPRSSPLAPIMEQPQRETESQPHPATTMLSVPRQLRSRSRTPERIEKVVESPRLEAIKESPTKPSDSPTSSPTRRSLRSRSRTPEVEVPQEPQIIEGKTRILRSRAKTPEKVMSPKKELKSAKKPLARIVLEANAFAVTKQILEKEPELNEEEKESIIECTPMKTLKQVSSLMDVTISPIVSKSILQSSSDSMLSESVKETKTADDTVADLDVKSIPGFTMNETCFGKSVLHSYESSAAENTQTEESIKETKADENVSKLDIKSLPAFSINESLFDKSVLHSYQSSVGEASSIEDENKTFNNDKIELKPSPGSLSLSVNDFDKSVLGSCDVSAIETIEDKNEKGTNKPNLSSLMTSDSDIEMKDQWEDKTDKQDTASIIQKEKEKIVEIEREIHEIEGDMSDEDDDSEGEVEEESESDSEEQDADTDETESESSEEAAFSDPEEVISINDSSVSSSSEHELEEKPNKEMQTIPVISAAKVVEVNIQKQNTQNDDEEHMVKEANQIAEVNIEKEETDKKDVQDVEISTDPLNQACMSMMTDDNSERDLDQSQMDLNYSDEKGEADKVDKEIAMETDVQPPTEKVVHIEVIVEVAPADIEELEQTNPTTDSISDQNTKQVSKAMDEETKSVSQDTDLTDVVDARRMDVAIEETTFKSNKNEEQSTENKTVEEKTEKVDKIVSKDDDVPKLDERTSSPPEPEIKKLEDMNVAETKKIEVEAIVTESQKLEENKVEEETVKEKPSRTRKRAQSTSSNKSTKEEKIEEPKTSVTRKRSQSNASNKSATEVEDKTPETGKNEVTSTPSSRTRAKTPTSTEVRKILTRRASKELSLLEKMDDTQSSILEESTLTTPKRRSARVRSKNTDDNASIASVSSVKSTRSKASEDAGDLKLVRKGRKSVVQTKPDLSVIPELAVEEGSKVETNQDIINEYSSSRRLTRNQKSVLDSLLARKPSPRRRASAASRSVSENSHDDDDDADSSTHSAAFDVQSMDRMSLLNKGDFDGSPDLSEIPSNASPESIASDASKQRRARVTRAASESKATPKAAKIHRRVSIDIAATPETGSPSTAEAGSVRGRRASFNRACEALHTPKSRRTSTDIRTDSQPGSPAASEPMAPSTPSRRTRRAGSTHSTPSQTKSDAGKRSKKSSAVEESKDTKN